MFTIFVDYYESMSICNVAEKLDLCHITLLANAIFRSNIGNYVSIRKLYLPLHGRPDSNPEFLFNYLFLQGYLPNELQGESVDDTSKYA